MPPASSTLCRRRTALLVTILPPAILDKLADGLHRTVASEEVRRQFTNVGTVPAFDGPAAFTDFMARDIERNVALLKAANFEPE